MLKIFMKRIFVVLGALVFAAAIGCKSSDDGGGVNDSVFTVSNAGIAAVNGTYTIDTENGDDPMNPGTWNGKPLYVHSNGIYFIAYESKTGCEMWTITENLFAVGGFERLYRYAGGAVNFDVPPSGNWQTICGNTETAPAKVNNPESIRGKLWVGQELVAPQRSDESVWYRCDDEMCTTNKTQIGTGSTYTLTASEVDKYISCEIASLSVALITPIMVQAAPPASLLVEDVDSGDPSGVAGTYNLAGELLAMPYYKHASLNYYINADYCGTGFPDRWNVTKSLMRRSTTNEDGPMFSYTDTIYSPYLGEWDGSCDQPNSGNITVSLP
jgi:hypothetical protein